MKHILKTENLMLTLEPQIFEADLKYAINTIMNITVISHGFSGEASMDIDAKELGRFAQDLYALYDALVGEARIEEPYGYRMFLKFSGDGLGHIRVSGCLKSAIASNIQELKFENCFDQTYLQGFAQDVFETYKKYSLI